MAKPIAPGSADYNNSKQKYASMKRAQRQMNNPAIGGTKRKEAAVKYRALRLILEARGYCPETEPV